MAQSDFGTIVPSTKSGTALAGDLNGFRTAINSMHSGSSRPAYAIQGTMWRKDISSTTQEIYIFDGSDDILIGTYNPTLNTFAIRMEDGSIPPSKLASGGGGLITGLNADMVDSIHGTSFVRKDASSDVAQGYSVRFAYSINLDGNDGKINARQHDKGLNIIGIASESGDGNRYITSWGTWKNYGSLQATGALTGAGVSSTAGISASGGAIQALSDNRVEVQGSYPRFHWHRPSGYAWIAYLDAATNEIRWNAATDGSGNGGSNVISFNTSGQIWTSNYGWLHDRYARRDTALGAGGMRVSGNCGNQATGFGYEVFDVGDGRHQVRYFVDNCTDCVNCANCNCNCDCTCGGTCVIEGTMVSMADGTEKAVDRLRPGDEVVGAHGGRGIVAALVEVPLGNRKLVNYEGVRMTPDHPVMVDGAWLVADQDALDRHRPARAPIGNLTLVGDYSLAQKRAGKLWGMTFHDAPPETRMFTPILVGSSSFLTEGVISGALQITGIEEG